ncbi:HAMP domain-containing sensor histidine kinase [Terrisporobacter mayombei]|uniref:histidine kinase n=1 Tax=Terrisporobacter mayombei TaxID=1541 RepID=A0ABY9PZ41_9FIRM|nr:HAMP domain-containing sensor histidine kinase [Terrisporobacter mayombei]MCC3868385.1 HAMP domain-containing histidine kinase [Terrisporobacter mayombei]WMT80533.1 Sensor histidine kinase RcsC [Terrisporobacter mayombei]
MKKILKFWNSLNIKYKLFTITSGLLIFLAFIVYLTLYFFMPAYYHQYKIELLKNSVNSIVEDSKFYDLEELQQRLYFLGKKQNVAMILTDDKGFIIFGKNEQHITNKYAGDIPMSNQIKEYTIRATIKLKDSPDLYHLEIAMPLQPIDEANTVLRNILPFIIISAFFIALLGAYIYSKTITKPLIEIINKEREEEQKRKEFIATISHELKTPITIISGQLEGMIYNVGKYKDRETYLQKSYESTQELKVLVDEMMEISKNELQEKDLKIEVINLSEMLGQLVNRQSYLIENKNLNLVYKVEDKLFIKADKEKIIKVLNNLINNAIKYSPQNEKIIVKAFKSKASKTVVLEIENTGVTIEQKYLSEVFNPFYRVEKSRNRKTGGSGLGLYIVSKILKSHNLYYKMESKKNSVLFTIYF